VGLVGDKTSLRARSTQPPFTIQYNKAVKNDLFRTVVMQVYSLELYTSLSQRGVKGEVRFTSGEEAVSVSVNLEVAEGSAGEYTWGIYEFPIDYTQVSPGPTYFCGYQ
jgi:hypothetical protein